MSFFHGCPLTDSYGKIFGALETLQVIIERKIAEEVHLKSERLFRILLNFACYSIRCPFIPKDSDSCPGTISKCPHCNGGMGCHRSVATIFSTYFSPVS
jgi:hypothetical protein